ncbi:MAG: hypothetical protein Q9M41_09285 [Paracoccaceae bacterium]|nr:hypothetical protein [Paracoccaceae bacterium]
MLSTRTDSLSRRSLLQTGAAAALIAAVPSRLSACEDCFDPLKSTPKTAGKKKAKKYDPWECARLTAKLSRDNRSLGKIFAKKRRLSRQMDQLLGDRDLLKPQQKRDQLMVRNLSRLARAGIRYYDIQSGKPVASDRAFGISVKKSLSAFKARVNARNYEIIKLEMKFIDTLNENKALTLKVFALKKSMRRTIRGLKKRGCSYQNPSNLRRAR